MKKIWNKFTPYKDWSITIKYLSVQISVIIFALLISYLPLTILVRNMLEDTIEQIMSQASKTASTSIENSLEYWTETWAVHTSSPIVHQILKESNKTWDDRADRNSLIEERDQIWTSNEVQKIKDYPVWINDLLNSDLSKEFSRIMNSYNTEQGSQDIAEIIVTNKYGVNVATTGLTTDYYQADEAWWQNAVNERIYVSNLVFDKSLNAEGIEIAIKIENGNKQLLGVVKIILKTNLLFEDVDALMQAMKERAGTWCGECGGLNVRLYDGGKNLVYRLEEPEYIVNEELEIIEKLLAGEITKEEERFELTKESIPPVKGEKVLLFVHKKPESSGLENITVFEYNKDEAFMKVRRVERTILITLIGVFVVAVTFSFFTVNKIVSPILELMDVTRKFGKGNKSVRSSINTDDEIGKLSETFNEMADSLMEVDKAKTEFISLASHQLRTPLGIMGWNLEMLKTGDFGDLTNQMEHALDDVIEKNDYLKKLVNDLLNVSEIEGGRIINQPKETNVFKLTKKVINDWESEAKKRKIKLTQNLDESLTKINIDAEKYEQIVDNLISNSIKYSNENTEVKINLEKQGNKFTFAIKDEGIGISEEDLKKITDRFFRASNVYDKETEGTGLGLYIIKRYVQAMKGELHIESELNKGTEVLIQFPINKS